MKIIIIILGLFSSQILTAQQAEKRISVTFENVRLGQALLEIEKSLR
jgi:hypothetical protein